MKGDNRGSDDPLVGLSRGEKFAARTRNAKTCELRKGANGCWYVHWTEGRRSARLSLREKHLATAKARLRIWAPDMQVAVGPPEGSVSAAAAGWSDATEKKSDIATFSLRRNDAGLFYLHWSEGRRSKRVSTRSRDIDSAKIFLRDWLKVDASGTPTCADLWAFYMREHIGKKESKSERHFYAWQAIAGRFGPLRPAEINRQTIEEHVKARAPTKPSTIFVELRLMTASWMFGVKRRLLAPTDVPPLDELGIPGPPPPRSRWLRTDEVKRLFAAAAAMRRGSRLSRVERLMWLALQTGSRRGALLELKWDQVDFETRVIHLNPDGRMQTSKKRASVPITNALLPILQRAHSERINEFVLDQPKRMHDQLNAVAARAGVQGVTAHVFRHTAATWLARRGVPLWKIAKFLGNSVEEVERTDAKHCPNDLRQDVEVLSEPFEVAADEL